MTYTHGQKVMCEIEGVKITDARISINENGRIFICQNEMNGLDADNKLGYKYSHCIFEGTERQLFNNFVTNLRPAEKSFDYPEVGDEYVDKDGDSRFVLGVAGRVIFLSSSYDKNLIGTYSTKEKFVELGFTIKQPAPTEEVLEVTLDEVAEKFGVDVTKLKVKKS